MQKGLRLCYNNNSHADISNEHNKAQALIDIKTLMSTIDDKIMWDSYIEYFTTDKFKKKSCDVQTSFHILCRELTSSDKVLITSVSYVQILLLAETIELLQDVLQV